MQRNHRNLLIPALILLLMLILLSGCNKESAQEEAAVTPIATISESDAAAPQSNVAAAPSEIVVKTTLRPAIDPACLEDKGKFALASAPMPDEGLEPGMIHVFCATGAPAGEMVTFTLKSPGGQEQTFQSPSVDQGTVTAAVQPITIGADAEPGKWTLTASYQDQQDSMDFQVRPPSQPFIVLTEPVETNPIIIRVAVGGLAPNSQARFAIYRLQAAQTEANMAEAHGELLLDNVIQTDDSGRADLMLDVADQPGGPYLLTLLPPDAAETVNAVIQLPEEERTVLALNIQRGEEAAPSTPSASNEPVQEPAVAEQPATFTPESLPPAPVPAEAGGGLPQTVTVSIPDASLPPCNPTTATTLQFWPQEGEVGQWWFGCATGFAPNRPLRVDAVLGNGTTASFDLTKTNDAGTKTFRWYSVPEEGTGDFSITVSDLTGNKAQLSWQISPATQPHLMVYPHVVIKDIDTMLYLTGFPQRTKVQLGVYQLDETGTGTLVNKLTVKTNKQGIVGQTFDLVKDLVPGAYMLMAQSSPAYTFSGIDTPATAIEFFSVGIPLDEKYEFYTLFLGHDSAASIASTGGEQPAATPSAGTTTPEETPAPAAAAQNIPTTMSIPVDNSPPPTCPNAKADAPTICMMPKTIERGTYIYFLMHGFQPNTQFVIAVKTPTGINVKLTMRANKNGIADAHWYALNDEKTGVYQVAIRGGKKRFRDAFKIVKATSPNLVVQPRSPKPGTPVIVSVSGLKPTTAYTLAFYRSTGEANGKVQFELAGTKDITTGKGGGAQISVDTKGKDEGKLLMAAVYEKNGSKPLAKEVFSPGQELYLRYPFAWGGK